MIPRATVIIAAYEAADVLARSIAAAQAQSGVSVDIVVVDDASQDQTTAVANEYSHVTVIKLEENSGPAAARNRAIEAAQGDWIVVLDADDTMQPGRIADMIAVAENAEADVVLGNFLRVDNDEQPIDAGPFLMENEVDPRDLLTLETYVVSNNMAPNRRNLGYLKPIFRRRFLERFNVRYDETLRNSEDYHIVLALLSAGARVIISPRPDYLYQVSEGSISHRVPANMISRLIDADDKFEKSLGAASTPTLRRLLGERKDNLVNIMHGEKVLGAIKERRFLSAVGMLVARPRTGPRVFRQLREAIANRLPKR